ncbi:MAG: hypothetical protein M1817_000948 [Caeruleum heppii]|nr:MAG: hypothetical protein M1817_000948 [Caeruleum heppii]
MKPLSVLLVVLTLVRWVRGDGETDQCPSKDGGAGPALKLQRRYEPTESILLDGPSHARLNIYRGRLVRGFHFLDRMSADFEIFVAGLAEEDDPLDLPQFDFWPTAEYQMKFEVRPAVPDCQDPVIDLELLQGLSKTMSELFDIWEQKTYEFTATITDQDAREAFFTVRFFELQPIRTEQMPNVEFNDRDLDNIFATKREILQHTTPDDLLLFLGNTASYFYYAFGPEDPRQVALIPYSGKPYSQGRFPTPVQLESFKNRYLKPAFNQREFERVIIIDHARTGQSVADFVRVLKEANVYDGKPFLIDLAYRTYDYDAYVDDDRVITQIAKIRVGTAPFRNAGLERLDLGQVGRILPYYPAVLWETPYEQVPNADGGMAVQIIEMIEDERDDPPSDFQLR